MRARRTLLPLTSLLLVTLSLPVFAQKAPAAGASGGNRTTTTVPTPSRPTMPTTPIPQMLIYNGKVHVSGPPLQDSAKVVARCYGGRAQAAIYSAFTDLKGNFSITIGQGQTNAPMDASVDPIDPLMGSARAGMQMMQCDVTASAPGYIPSQITVQFRSSLDNTEMGKLILQPMGGPQNMESVVSAISLAAPENAQHEYAKGIQDLRDQKFDKAEKHFRKATEEYPKYAIAWEKLGRLQSQSQNRPDARASFQKAIDADPKYVPPYLQMATMDAEESKWDSVLQITNHILSIDGQHFPNAYFLNSAANYNLGNDAAAEKSGLRASDLDKQHQMPRVELLLAEIFNRSGRPEAAAQHFRRFLELDPNSQDAAGVRTRLAKLEVAATK